MTPGDRVIPLLANFGVQKSLWVLADEAPALALPTKALWVYMEVALAIGPDPRFADEACVSLLVQAVLAVDGQWADVEELIARDEPVLAFLNPWHARQAWEVHGGDWPLFDEQVAA